MPARLAYGMFYATVIAGTDDDGRLKIDALLGDPRAEAELERRRRASVAAMDVEVG